MAQMVAPTRERDPDSRFVLLVRSHAVQRLTEVRHGMPDFSDLQGCEEGKSFAYSGRFRKVDVV